MTKRNGRYEKADSFDSLLPQVVDKERVHARLKAIWERLMARQDLDYDQQIVFRACQDILEAPDSSREPRFALNDLTIQEIELLDDPDLPRYLLYRYRYEMFHRMKRLDDFPPCLQIEPSSICNYRCVFCYQTDPQFTNPKSGHMGLMSPDLFKRIVDQAQGRCEAVTLASRGEPLLNPRIGEMLAYAGNKFLALKLNTNALLLTERLSHAVLEAGVNTVVFSVDSASDAEYNRLRIGGKFDKVVSNIRRFQEIRVKKFPKSKIITRVSGVKYSDDQDFGSMELFWKAFVNQVVFVKYNPWENTYQKPVNDISAPCSDLWRRTFVWFDGAVNPCDIDYRSTMTVGNAREKGLSDIWTGPEYQALRIRHLSNDRGSLNLCARCAFA
ncbi:MAG: radical SAM protein [Deltaproteobacteria bacterium]|nr:radical SAM protein [Deltaproteobacteria bacterium]